MDFIVNLYDLNFDNLSDICSNPKVRIVRALSPNSDMVVEYIKKHFNDNWASEAKSALYKTTSTCFIAIDKSEIVGFACYDATCKGFFGPTGVTESYRGQRIGKALLLYTLRAMKEDGYAYAIIGWAGDKAISFYEKNAKAVSLNNVRSVYDRLVK